MDAGLLILRLVVGLTMAAHGAQKLFGWFGGHGIRGTADFFESLGFRPGRVFAVIGGAAELGGGLSLAAGLLTPFGAAAVIGMMLAAIVSVHLANGFFVTNGGFEYPFVLAAAAAALAFTGPGAASADAALDWSLSGTGWGLFAVGLGAAAAAATLAARALAQRHSGVAGVAAPSRA